MTALTHLSLFSGIGGLDMAAEWAGMETIGQCEWAEYPARVLEKHWPDIPRWKDIRTLTKESFYERTGRRTVDVISGGFPCQPFSVAGKQRGKEDDRYLWPEMVRVIKELRPTWVVGENVAGIVRMALPDILSELEGCGYRTRTFLIPACAVGARHRRYRVAIVGYSEHDGLSAATIRRSVGETSTREPEREIPSGESEGAGEPRDSETVGRTKKLEDTGGGGCGEPKDVCKQQGRAEPERSGKDMANTYGAGLQTERAGKQAAGAAGAGGDVAHAESFGERGLLVRAETKKPRPISGSEDAQHTDNAETSRHREYCREIHKKPESERFGFSGCAAGTAQSGLGGVADGLPGRVDGSLDFIIDHYWDVEPDIPRIAEGVPNRVCRLKALGNAVVPQQFYPIFKAIAEVEKQAGGRPR